MKNSISRVRREAIAVWIAAGLYAVSLVLILRLNGALGIPRNDDAFYITSLFQFADKNVFIVQQPNLIGQVLLALPLIKIFGNQIAPLQILNCVIGSVSLIACYFTVRTYLNKIGSAIAVMSLAFCPIYINIISSFMTDGMSISFQIFSIYFLTKFMRNVNSSKSFLIAALVCSLIAFSIRQFGAISGVVIVIGAVYSGLVKYEKTFKRFAFGISATYLVVVAIGFYWHSSQQNQVTVDSDKSFSFIDLVHFGQGWTATIGIYLIPALLLGVVVFSGGLIKQRLTERLGMVAFATLGLLAFLNFRTTPGGNYFGKFVAYAGTKRMEIPDLLGTNEFKLLKVFVGLVYILGTIYVYQLLVLKKHRKIDAVFVLHSTFVALSIVAVFLAVGGFGFDRYHLVVIPFVSALILHQVGLENVVKRISYLPAFAFVVIAGFYSYKALDLSTNVDGKAWKMTNELVDMGIKPLQINGSYEWNVYHRLYDGKTADLTHIDQVFNDWFDPNTLSSDYVGRCYSLQSKPDEKFSILYKKSAAKTLFGQEILALIYKDSQCN
jgi:hypothetical protein